MSLLTGEPKKSGSQAYIQDIGEYTSLIIEGKRQAGDTIYTYDFYKVSLYKNYISRVTVYGEYLTPFQLLKCVRSYIYYREKYLKEERTVT